MIAELSVIPIGEGSSISPYVTKAVGIIENSGLEYKVTDFGTVIEGDWDKVMDVAKRCHYAIMEDAGRVLTRIIIDERADRNYKLGDKIKSIERNLGREVRK